MPGGQIGSALYLHYPLFPAGPVAMTSGLITINGSLPPYQFPLNDTSPPGPGGGNGNRFGTPKGRTTFSLEGLGPWTHTLEIAPGNGVLIFDGLTSVFAADLQSEAQLTLTTHPQVYRQRRRRACIDCDADRHEHHINRRPFLYIGRFFKR